MWNYSLMMLLPCNPQDVFNLLCSWTYILHYTAIYICWLASWRSVASHLRGFGFVRTVCEGSRVTPAAIWWLTALKHRIKILCICYRPYETPTLWLRSSRGQSDGQRHERRTRWPETVNWPNELQQADLEFEQYKTMQVVKSISVRRSCFYKLTCQASLICENGRTNSMHWFTWSSWILVDMSQCEWPAAEK